MSPRWRVVLAVVGLVLVALSLVALAYALWPVEPTLERQPLLPTLFVPPQSWAMWMRWI